MMPTSHSACKPCVYCVQSLFSPSFHYIVSVESFLCTAHRTGKERQRIEILKPFVSGCHPMSATENTKTIPFLLFLITFLILRILLLSPELPICRHPLNIFISVFIYVFININISTPLTVLWGGVMLHLEQLESSFFLRIYIQW